MIPVSTRVVRALAWFSLFVLLGGWFSLAVLGDRVWWTVPLLFGPRWLLAAPWLGIIPWLWTAPRRAAVPALAGLGIAMFGLIGWHPGLQRGGPAPGVPIRVLELNAEGSHSRIADIAAEIRDHQPDLVVIVECNVELARALGTLPMYHVRTSIGGALCLFSRGEIVAWNQQDGRNGLMEGGSAAPIRAVVATAAGAVRVGIVHLASPRNALDNYFGLSALLHQRDGTSRNLSARDQDSAESRAWIMSGTELPTIIAGDFNLPVESAIYRRHWGDLRNAFSRAGTGTGYTKYTRFWGVRIDHVLATGDIGTHRSVVGRDVGSDHRPLIADLVLPVAHRTSTAR